MSGIWILFRNDLWLKDKWNSWSFAQLSLFPVKNQKLCQKIQRLQNDGTSTNLAVWSNMEQVVFAEQRHFQWKGDSLIALAWLQLQATAVYVPIIPIRRLPNCNWSGHFRTLFNEVKVRGVNRWAGTMRLFVIEAALKLTDFTKLLQAIWWVMGAKMPPF